MFRELRALAHFGVLILSTISLWLRIRRRLLSLFLKLAVIWRAPLAVRCHRNCENRAVRFGILNGSDPEKKSRRAYQRRFYIIPAIPLF